MTVFHLLMCSFLLGFSTFGGLLGSVAGAMESNMLRHLANVASRQLGEDNTVLSSNQKVAPISKNSSAPVLFIIVVIYVFAVLMAVMCMWAKFGFGIRREINSYITSPDSPVRSFMDTNPIHIQEGTRERLGSSTRLSKSPDYGQLTDEGNALLEPVLGGLTKL
jgi:hypothetical protein